MKISNNNHNIDQKCISIAIQKSHKRHVKSHKILELLGASICSVKRFQLSTSKLGPDIDYMRQCAKKKVQSSDINWYKNAIMLRKIWVSPEKKSFHKSHYFEKPRSTRIQCNIMATTGHKSDISTNNWIQIFNL